MVLLKKFHLTVSYSRAKGLFDLMKIVFVFSTELISIFYSHYY